MFVAPVYVLAPVKKTVEPSCVLFAPSVPAKIALTLPLCRLNAVALVRTAAPAPEMVPPLKVTDCTVSE